ncbi:hypothetical protein JYU34_019062 [Plutella xylostella]|uniref:Uncharacterized protein n=1 Tax=Plutella xylostella TaxID=51655 RepID=A0ABQ7PZ30_PLUXY|nr:hypothetical protein JYU34_019062 [Plutella xylostella]
MYYAVLLWMRCVDLLSNKVIFIVPTAAVQGVVGKKASLPCDIQPLTAGDQVSMVLWFKEADGEPLYRYTHI